VTTVGASKMIATAVDNTVKHWESEMNKALVLITSLDQTKKEMETLKKKIEDSNGKANSIEESETQ